MAAPSRASARSGGLTRAQELVAIQAGGPRDIGFFGTRNMGFLHQQLIEILSYAMVLTVRVSPLAPWPGSSRPSVPTSG